MVKQCRIILSALLLLSILFSTNGIAVYKHYCGDFLANLSLFTPGHGCGDEEAEGCDMDNAGMDCCEDETEFYQAELDLIKQEQSAFAFSFFTLSIESAKDVSLFKTFSGTINLTDRGPPDLIRPLYIRFSRLTYYG